MNACSPQRRRGRRAGAERTSARPPRSPRLCGKTGLASFPLIPVALLALLLTPVAQPPSYPQSLSSLHQWGAVTLFHGLPSDHVRAIAQDTNGMMWFGTDGGLVKYDGRRIQKITTDGLAALRVLSLKLDDRGVLWIGTESGAARLINGEIKPITETRDSAVTSIITPEAGRAMMTTEQGEIIVCETAHDGSLTVHKISPADHPLLDIESRSESREHAPLRLTSLVLLNNALIVGTRGRGLLAIDATQIKASATPAPELIKEILSRPRPFFVDAIETDARGNFWLGAETSTEDSGLFQGTELTRPEKIGAGVGTVTALKADARGNTWVGTDARGAFVYRDGRRLDQFSFENTGGGLLSNHIYSVFIDREGVAWFGTDRGVCRYDPRALRVEAISADTESNFVRALFRSSDGTLWSGTNRGLLARKDSIWQEVPDLKGKVVHSIAGDSSGRLLVGTASGLFEGQKLSTGRRTGSFESTAGRAFVRIENAPGTADNIRAIGVFQGAVYIADFGRGVERLDGSKRTLVWPDESTSGAREREVVSLHAEKDWLWIGTAEAGVFRFNGKQARIDHALGELIGAAVWSIEGSIDDVLWLASARGFYALKSGKLRRVVGDVDARCVVAASEQAVWCATNGGGLYKVLLDEGAADSFLTTRIDSEQGMPSQNVFTVLREASDDEVLWIGTSRGVARYDPGREPPLLDITRVIGKRVYSPEELRAGLDLEYPQNSLAVEVRAISSRTFPEQFQYIFSVMDNQDRVISEKRTSESQLLIENLRPGHYRVTARAFTNDLVPSDRVQFNFVVARAPFPWTSSALAVLLGLALVAMWWGYRQNRKLFGANRQLADTRLQLANETETERRRIARDLHDQTLADLRRLMLLTDRLPASENTNGYVKPSDFRDEIEAISTEIRRICEDLSPSALANVGLGAALEWALTDALAHQLPESRFEYEFVCELGSGETTLGVETQIQIFRIVQEAISNICRHSGASQVSLKLMIGVNRDLVIELEDNGCGFDRHNQARAGRGLSNMRSRASMIDAQIEWSTKPQGGTRFILRKGPHSPSTNKGAHVTV